MHVCEPNLSLRSEFLLSIFEQVIVNTDIILLLVDHKPFKENERGRVE